MAKTKKFSDKVTNWDVTPKTKNIVWEYTGEGNFAFNINVNYDDTQQVFAPYLSTYRNIATRDGDNLVVTTIFAKSNGTVKTIKNTFKNYFKSTENDSVNFSTNELFSELDREGALYDYEILPSTNLGKDGLYGQVQTDFVLTPTDSKTEFEFKTQNDNYTYAFNNKGNNDYLINDEGTDSIVELKGNEKYTKMNVSELYVYDYNGKDKYTVEKGYLYAEDYKGNDEYKFRYNGDGTVGDKAGNDIYHLIENIYSPNLFDLKGNDKYYLTDSNANIVDQNGKDYYEIKKANETYISDSGKGNDTYKISDSSDLDYETFLISDANGKDNYTFNNVSFKYNSYVSALEDDGYAIQDENGKDKYSMTDSEYVIIKDINGKENYSILGNSQYIKITDNGGNDTYNLNGYDKKNNIVHYVSCCNIYDNGKSSDVYKMDYTDSVNIYDDGGKNKFNIKNSTDTIIYAENYKDTYNLTNTQSFSIDDCGETVGDIYNITNSTGYITDLGGNDSYTLSQFAEKAAINITDKGGTKDKLTLKDMSKNDIVFMANVGDSGYKDNSVFLFNKSNGSYIRIMDFFERATDGYISGFGDGNIETMKAGKKSLSVDYNYMNQIREEVSTFLSEDVSVMTVLDNQDTYAGTLQNLIACFTKE